jgi:hypothetical protein
VDLDPDTLYELAYRAQREGAGNRCRYVDGIGGYMVAVLRELRECGLPDPLGSALWGPR